MIRRPTTILALLTALNLLNYLDRFVLSAVLPKIQEDLSLTNLEGGWLGTVFLLGYFATSPIFGYLGDRKRRPALIALGIIVWSLATVASGLARDLRTLLVARAVVGIGEASYATIAPTIIDDVAPADRKSRWLAVFFAAMPIGSALGFGVGGAVAKHFDWRMAFFVAGMPGMVIAAACLFIDEPPRHARERPDWVASFRQLVAVPVYVRTVLGYAAYTFAVGGFGFWAPKFLYTRYSMDLATANLGFGALTVVGGAIGTAIGGWLGDRATHRRLDRDPHLGAERAFVLGNLRVCFWGSAIGAPLAAACFLAPGPTAFFALVLPCEIALFLNSSPVNGVLLRSVPPGLRAGAMALSIFAIHMFGDLWSPPLIGALADHLPIQVAMMALPVAIVLSALFFRESPSG
jgi:MFS family permease